MRWSSMHGGLASGSSGSLTSQFDLQGVSDSMAHFSPEGMVMISGSGIAVWALLSPWLYPWCRVGLSVSAFSGWFSVLKVLVLK